MTAQEQKDIGRLIGITESMKEHLENIETKMDDWTANGCPTGARLEKKVESLYTKVIALGLLVAAGGHGAGEIIRAFIK